MKQQEAPVLSTTLAPQLRKFPEKTAVGCLNCFSYWAVLTVNLLYSLTYLSPDMYIYILYYIILYYIILYYIILYYIIYYILNDILYIIFITSICSSSYYAWSYIANMFVKYASLNPPCSAGWKENTTFGRLPPKAKFLLQLLCNPPSAAGTTHKIVWIWWFHLCDVKPYNIWRIPLLTFLFLWPECLPCPLARRDGSNGRTLAGGVSEATFSGQIGFGHHKAFKSSRVNEKILEETRFFRQNSTIFLNPKDIWWYSKLAEKGVSWPHLHEAETAQCRHSLDDVFTCGISLQQFANLSNPFPLNHVFTIVNHAACALQICDFISLGGWSLDTPWWWQKLWIAVVLQFTTLMNSFWTSLAKKRNEKTLLPICFTMFFPTYQSNSWCLFDLPSSFFISTT